MLTSPYRSATMAIGSMRCSFSLTNVLMRSLRSKRVLFTMPSPLKPTNLRLPRYGHCHVSKHVSFRPFSSISFSPLSTTQSWSHHSRKWHFDQILALISWLLIGQGLFILVGTTTFASLLLFLANSLQFQEYVALQLSQWLTREMGIQVVLDSAMGPHWKEGKIEFKKVRLTRQRKQLDYPVLSAAFPELDLTVDSVHVTLSLWSFLDGRGLVRECSIQGVRGIIDYRQCDYSSSDEHSSNEESSLSLDRVTVKDVLVTLLYPEFRPYNLSILSGSWPRLRKQWLWLDVMHAEAIVGQYDECLFSVHTPQDLSLFPGWNTSADSQKSLRHFKIHGLALDHINSGHDHIPFSWLKRGSVDVDALMLLPQEMTRDFLSVLPSAVFNQEQAQTIQQKDSLSFHVQVTLRHVRASLPQSYHSEMNPSHHPANFTLMLALMRPLVAYLNANNVAIPLTMSFNMPLTDFNGALHLYDAGMDKYFARNFLLALLEHASNDQVQLFHLTRVGQWSLTSMIRALSSAVQSVFVAVDAAAGSEDWEMNL